MKTPNIEPNFPVTSGSPRPESSSRRHFLGRAALLPAALSALNVPLTSLAAEADSGESYWRKVRQQFPFSEDKVPMNAANLCPSPTVVARRVTELTRDIDVDCSFNNRDKFKQLLETSRSKVAQQMGVSSDEIALVRNTSEANNVINNGLNLRAGDEIVLWEQNHPTNNVAWDVRAARYGLQVKRISTPRNPQSVEELIRVFTNAFSAKTRVLALTHVSNVSGQRLPVKELCRLAHRRHIHVHVDGAQTWGALDVNLRDLNCDSYAASAHKWFVGPKEVGLLYVRQDRIDDIWPNIVAPGWGGDVEPDVEGARKFESLGQRDDAALSAIADTVDFHASIGAQRIEQRVYELAGFLKQELAGEGFKFVTPLDPQLSGGVCILEAPPEPEMRTRIFNRLYEEYGIAGSTSGGLRLCPHLYNTREHVERAIAGIRGMRAWFG